MCPIKREQESENIIILKMSVTNSTVELGLSSTFDVTEEMPTNFSSSSSSFSMDSILDPQADTFLGFWLLGVLGSGIGFMGIFGNICSIRVLSHRQMRSSPNFILIALASSDLMLIVTSFLLFGWTTIYPYSGCMKDYFYRYQPIIATIAYPVGTIGEEKIDSKKNEKIEFF